MLRSTVSPLFVALLLLSTGKLFAQQNANGQLPVTTSSHPYVFLIRDPLVLDELRLNTQQKEAIQALNAQLDPTLWSMRNKGQERMQEMLDEATATAKDRMATILKPNQQRRLEQIELWAIGLKAFLGDGLPSALRLSESQRQEIRDQVNETEKAVLDLRKKVQDGKEDAQAAEKKASDLQSDLQREILAKLTDRQKQHWISLLGPRIDLASLGHVTFTPPEIVSEPDWINSPPLTLDELRGRVVALHFYAFGCINCKRNFPWYKEWHKAYRNRGLVVLGIQTPETQREKEVENVRKAAEENGLEYPIVHDVDKGNWDAWGNTMWPATYLIDKQGRVRYWWYGELDWKDTGGHKLMRVRIEELLTEGTRG